MRTRQRPNDRQRELQGSVLRTVYLTKELDGALRTMASKAGITTNQLVRELLVRQLRESPLSRGNLYSSEVEAEGELCKSEEPSPRFMVRGIVKQTLRSPRRKPKITPASIALIPPDVHDINVPLVEATRDIPPGANVRYRESRKRGRGRIEAAYSVEVIPHKTAKTGKAGK